jgi:hypothetical protein
MSVISHVDVKELNVRKKLMKGFLWSTVFMVLKDGYFVKQTRNTWKVLKCGAGERRGRSWTDRVRNEDV